MKNINFTCSYFSSFISSSASNEISISDVKSDSIFISITLFCLKINYLKIIKKKNTEKG